MAQHEHITGHLRVEQRSHGRVWVAKYTRAVGGSTRKVLGPAWVKDSGRRTARGAPVWRAADGVKPDGHLTPKEARGALDELVNRERGRPRARQNASATKTFGQALEAYLAYLEVEKGNAPSTLYRYRSIVRTHLVPAFGTETPLRRVSTERIDAYRRRLLHDGRLSRSAIRQVMTVLHGSLKRAQRNGWIAHNPAADVERVALPRPSGEFNVLDASQIEAVARVAESDWRPVSPGPRNRTVIAAPRARALTAQRRADAALFAAAIRFAAHTGLRVGELRALRWRDVDRHNQSVHVRRNAPSSVPAPTLEKAPKSGRVRSLPLTDAAMATLEKLSRRPLFTSAGDYVFASPTGGLLDGNRVRDAFYSALQRAGLGHLRNQSRPITFHDLRHTFGTLAVRAFPVTDVQAMMGHADISTTMRYVHHVPRHDAARQLSSVFAVDAGPSDLRGETPSSSAAGVD